MLPELCFPAADLYSVQKITLSDPLHWSGPNLTWNYMYAECHSTKLRKNHDLAKDSYTNTWSDVYVACESRHGPCSTLGPGEHEKSLHGSGDVANGFGGQPQPEK